MPDEKSDPTRFIDLLSRTFVVRISSSRAGLSIELGQKTLLVRIFNHLYRFLDSASTRSSMASPEHLCGAFAAPGGA
jgi:hypothetical protein